MSETPEMVERVAAALYEVKSPREWRVTEEWVKSIWRELAGAAIAEMREPTELMLCECTDAWGEPIGTGKNFWQAMIDAAMKG
jgi:hypothetical protein